MSAITTRKPLLPSTTTPSATTSPQHEDAVLTAEVSDIAAPDSPLAQLEEAAERGNVGADMAPRQRSMNTASAGYGGPPKVKSMKASPAKATAVQGATQAKTKSTGVAKDTKNHVAITLSNGRQVQLPKHSTDGYFFKTKYAYTSVVNKQGKARFTGKLSPAIDKKMCQFLTKIDTAIQTQEKKVAATKAKGSFNNFWSGELKNAKAQLQELKQIKHFGSRFFYDVQASNAGKGKPVLAQFQGGPGTGKFDGKGTIEHPETVEGMRAIYHRSNASVVREVQSSKKFYQALGAGR